MSRESKPLRSAIITLLVLIPFWVWFLFLRPESQGTLDNKLMNAVVLGETENVKALLAKGANPNVIKRDVHLRSALMYAVASGEPEIVQALIDKGADVNYKDTEGNTPLKILRLTMPKNVREIESILLKAGAHL